MSNRVYLSIDIAVIPEQEDTPVSLRIQVSAATVKAEALSRMMRFGEASLRHVLNALCHDSPG